MNDMGDLRSCQILIKSGRGKKRAYARALLPPNTLELMAGGASLQGEA